LDAAACGEQCPGAVDGLFVYGTLLRGEPRFPLLRPFGLECTLLASTWGSLVDFGEYPAMLPPRVDGDLVRGDFFRLRDIGGALRRLDRIEGFLGFGLPGSLFRRELIEIDGGDGRIRMAWCYVLAAHLDAEQTIPSGDWREHRGRREDILRRLIAAHAAGDEAGLALSLAQRMPFAFGGDPKAVAQELLPLTSALLEGIVSERRLAQESGSWVTIP
jgi:gamma-glutamylcyclotransferase (GGCT)/AIG2-like uncharacterized protein YtfP